MLSFNTGQNCINRQFYSLIKGNIICKNEEEANFLIDLFERRKKLLDKLKELNQEINLNNTMEYFFRKMS